MNKQTQKRNAAFKAATKQERAVMVAKDALKMLNAGKTKATTGNWVTLEDKFDSEIVQDTQICDLSDKFKGCKVCVLGSLMLSEIRHTNKLKFGDVMGTFDYEYEGKRLNKIFSKPQQKLMELAFEGGGGLFGYYDVDDDKIIKIENFYSEYPDEEERLRAILKNVIKNGGKFVLPASL
jgi:hypothetical protein